MFKMKLAKAAKVRQMEFSSQTISWLSWRRKIYEGIICIFTCIAHLLAVSNSPVKKINKTNQNKQTKKTLTELVRNWGSDLLYSYLYISYPIKLYKKDGWQKFEDLIVFKALSLQQKSSKTALLDISIARSGK